MTGKTHMTGRCRDCRHWVDIPRSRVQSQFRKPLKESGLRLCSLLTDYENPDVQKMFNAAADGGFVAPDWIATAADFGCVLFEASERPVPE